MKRVVIVGRPNVGKSTLFNRWIGRRKALVHPQPGMTRDFISHSLPGYELIDTGGIDFAAGDDTVEMIRRQALFALDTADLVLFLTDGKEGPTALDEELAALLRRSGRPVFLVVNKQDARKAAESVHEFDRLGFVEVFPVSAEHGHGTIGLRERAEAFLGVAEGAEAEVNAPGLSRAAIVGRPNVGKSSLLNALLGSPRVSVSPIPGTTRDAVDVEVERAGERFIFLDTAGLRKAGKITAGQESLSVVKAMQSIGGSDLCLLVLDASQPIAHQDKEIARAVTDQHRGMIVVGNKADLLTAEDRKAFPQLVSDTFPYLPWAPVHLVSALQRTALGPLWKEIGEVLKSFTQRLPTGPLNRFFREATTRIPPKDRKFFFITQAAVRPPTFVLVGNRGGRLPEQYERYLENQFRTQYPFRGVPLKIVTKKR
ncbi:MAG TPA: ribosome biogenesis GTPase Der [Syntrophus sp. (in: bacteria)]|jgi:GTP-binding protein|nr:ribosome biogenesis GTPase Der [Syntrophus sp. (in: bacteria)]